MKEIRLNIPEGCKAVTVKVDGGKVITEFEPKEDKWQPKDGDILANLEPMNILLGKCIVIYKDTNKNGGIITYAGLSSPNGFLTTVVDTGWGYTEYYRPATEGEKQLLFAALWQKGKRWNAEKKCIEDLPRWRALYDENYYVIGSELNVDCTTEVGHVVDDNRNKVGNYFRTREAAEKVAKQIREIFKNSKAE